MLVSLSVFILHHSIIRKINTAYTDNIDISFWCDLNLCQSTKSNSSKHFRISLTKIFKFYESFCQRLSFCFCVQKRFLPAYTISAFILLKFDLLEWFLLCKWLNEHWKELISDIRECSYLWLLHEKQFPLYVVTRGLRIREISSTIYWLKNQSKSIHFSFSAHANVFNIG